MDLQSVQYILAFGIWHKVFSKNIEQSVLLIGPLEYSMLWPIVFGEIFYNRAFRILYWFAVPINQCDINMMFNQYDIQMIFNQYDIQSK